MKHKFVVKNIDYHMKSFHCTRCEQIMLTTSFKKAQSKLIPCQLLYKPIYAKVKKNKRVV